MCLRFTNYKKILRPDWRKKTKLEHRKYTIKSRSKIKNGKGLKVKIEGHLIVDQFAGRYARTLYRQKDRFSTLSQNNLQYLRFYKSKQTIEWLQATELPRRNLL